MYFKHKKLTNIKLLGNRLTDRRLQMTPYLTLSNYRSLGTLTEIFGAFLLILVIVAVTYAFPDITVGQGVAVITYMLIVSYGQKFWL